MDELESATDDEVRETTVHLTSAVGADLFIRMRRRARTLLEERDAAIEALRWFHDFFNVDVSMAVLGETLQQTLLAKCKEGLGEINPGTLGSRRDDDL